MDNFFANKGQTMNQYFSSKFKEAGEVVDAFGEGMIQGGVALAKFNMNLHKMNSVWDFDMTKVPQNKVTK